MGLDQVNMEKGYYIHFEGRSSVGISKKVDMQLEEFRKYFEMQELEVKSVPRNLLQRVLGLFPTASITRNYHEVLEQIVDPDFIYVRRAVADRAYVHFFKEIKRRYPDCRIVIEIFTYPYDKDDFFKIDAWPFYFKELLYRPQLKKYISRFVTYSDDKVIFGVPTIITTNGVIVDKICPISGAYDPKRITMIGVAYMQRQHGYERVIEGLKKYYQQQTGEKKEEIVLYLVGDGPEKKKYQKLVSKYGLEKYVSFFPIMTGQELDNLYNEADIALIAFGMYKVGYDAPIGAIKSRECLAKGIPMISGSPIDVLNEAFPYARIFPNDKTPVDMNEVVKFYRSFSEKDKNENAKLIHQYAKEHADMAVVMRPIVEYIK